VLTAGNRPRAGVDVAAKRKFMSFLGYRSGNSQPNGCARDYVLITNLMH